MTTEELRAAINEWAEKVTHAHEDNTPHTYANTCKMITDIDKIIAKAFDRDPVL